MFVDASAIVSILAVEADHGTLSARLEAASQVHTSAVALYEATLGLARATGLSVAEASSAVDRFVERTAIEITAITAEIGRIAVDAFERYGRGRHPARLNMGDCFAYACARSLGVPLLYKGDGFSQTDIA